MPQRLGSLSSEMEERPVFRRANGDTFFLVTGGSRIVAIRVVKRGSVWVRGGETITDLDPNEAVEVIDYIKELGR